MTLEQQVVVECMPVVLILNSWKILYLGPKTWNTLPAHTTGTSSFPTFKKRMYEFLLKESFRYGVFEANSLYKPDGFLRSPCHISTATFV